MKRISRFLARTGCAALLLLAGIGFSGAVLADTASNATISNTATLGYSVNGVSQTQICSSPAGNNTSTCTATTFKVDTKININVVTRDTKPFATAPGGQGTMTFTVSNTGNATQDISLSAVSNVANGQTVFSGANLATDSFDPSSCTIYDSTGTTVITKLSNVAAGAAVDVQVSCTITALKGGTTAYATSGTLDAALVALKGTVTAVGTTTPMANAARVDANTPGVVLADDLGSDDIKADASYSARSALVAAPGALTVSKTVATLCDPINGNTSPKAIPGAFVRYTVTITNAATAPNSVVLTSIADNLDANLNADVDFIQGATATSCATVASGNGVATGGSGKGVQIKWTGTATRASFGGTTGTTYLTSAPSTYTNTALSITSGDWTTVLPAEGTYAAGELKKGESVQVIFNAIIK